MRGPREVRRGSGVECEGRLEVKVLWKLWWTGDVL